MIDPYAPAGRRGLPKAASDLLSLADGYGWTTLVQWKTDTDGNDYVRIDIARINPFWYFQLIWRSRGTAVATLRLFGKTHQHIPIDGRGHGWINTPSLRYVAEIIRSAPNR